MKTKISCDYREAKPINYGPIVLCNVAKERCPYKKSLKVASFEGSPVFRCICDGKVERILQETPQTPQFF